MAYMSQELKKKLAPEIKSICQRYGVKATLSVHNHSTLVLNIKSGYIDFIGNANFVCGNDHYRVSRGFRPITNGYTDVNPYHYRSHFSGIALSFLTEVLEAMNNGNHDNSDIQTDYFDIGWYVDVRIGNWEKPYALESKFH